MNFYSYRYMLWHGGRQSATADAAINYTEHDKRYHHGNFDPKTMTCEMREAEAKGDLVDVLNAEQTEAEYLRMTQKLAKQKKKQEAEKARTDAARKVNQKTLADLATRTFSEDERNIVDEAVRYALSANPISVSMEEAIDTRKAIRSNKRKVLLSRMTSFFESKFPRGIETNGIGTVLVNQSSADSIVAHDSGGGLRVFKAAALFALEDLLKNGVLFAVNKRWKGRNSDSYNIVAPMLLGEQRWIVEITISKDTETGKAELYNVKPVKEEMVKELAQLDAALSSGRGKLDSLTTAHSIPNSQSEVNRHITEKSEKSETPKIPASNLVKQYLAAHGLLGRFLQK